MAYGDMQARIADEVLGDDVTTAHITNAIQTAILKYERRRFWFNEKRWDTQPITDGNGAPVTDGSGNIITTGPFFTTTPGIEFYDAGLCPLIGSAAHIDKLMLVQAGNRYTLNPQTPQWVDDHAVGLLWRAIPTDWCYTAQCVRLYPIPDSAYPIYAWGTYRFPALTQATDSNPWMVEAEALIRQEAKCILYSDIIRDQGMASVASQRAADYLLALERETAERGPPSRIRATQF